MPIEDDDFALRTSIWSATDRAYKDAVEELQKVQANSRVKVDADDRSDDFSQEPPAEYLEAPAALVLDLEAWKPRLRALSAEFRKYPELVYSGVSIKGTASTRYYTSSDGTRLQLPATHIRIMVTGRALAPDGMALSRNESFDVTTASELPTDAQIAAKIAQVGGDLVAMRKAPVAEPYLGPAILEGKAAGVFFHEVFGHRIEGHRQKNEDEGQTFAKEIGKPIMPDFIDVYDDPSIASIDGTDMNGFYRYDDEGIAGARASLVEHGVLETFLLERSPTRGFMHSNGHGRRQEGHSVVSRQGNLVVAPTRTVDPATLKAALLAEVKRQAEAVWPRLLRELDGGFTMTRRFEPQSFKLLPIMVYRIYPDGREELIRGADLEGTPLRALADITMAGNDVETFNGYCGAESGFVPVSATSPSLLVAHVEVAKKQRAEDKPPILPEPAMAAAGGSEALDAAIERAMKDELARSMDKLELPGFGKPYFLSYLLWDVRPVSVSASFGAIVRSDDVPVRTVHVDLRVGDYDFDNSNSQSDRDSHAQLPVEVADYDATRRMLWFATDRNKYKNAVEALERKRAVVKGEHANADDTVAAFAKEKPASVHVEHAAGRRSSARRSRCSRRSLSARAARQRRPGIPARCRSARRRGARCSCRARACTRRRTARGFASMSRSRPRPPMACRWRIRCAGSPNPPTSCRARPT